MTSPAKSARPQFRLAVEHDADTLLELMQAYYTFDGHGFDRAKARSALIALLRDASLGRVWLILNGGAAAGYVVLCFGYSLEWLGRDAFVDEFFLRDECRGLGWGRVALEFVEREARDAGIHTLHLEVVEKNVRALDFYRKYGFQEHRSRFLSKWIAKDFTKPKKEAGI